MSKSSHAQRLAQLRWYQVLKENEEKFQDSTGLYLMDKLRKVKFTKQGTIRQDKLGNMALQEFPSLVSQWRTKQDGS
jgi:hypothetical protein